MLDQTTGLVTPKPICKVTKLVAVGQYRGQTNDPSLISIRPFQQALNLHFVADLAFAESDHVAFIEDN